MFETLLRIDVALFFVVGLLGGAHCIGMCGPLVTMYSKQMSTKDDVASRKSRRGRHGSHLSVYEVKQHALFNVGRMASYTVLGGLFGGLGGLIFVASGQVAAGAEVVRGVVGIIIGGFVILVGARYALKGVATDVPIPGMGYLTRRLSSRVHALVNSPGIVGLGVIHGLFPCPILYPAFLFAFASGSVLSGALVLAALGLGTVPAVFGYGTLIGSVNAVHRRRIHRLLGVVFLVLGYVLFAHGLMAIGIHLPHPHFPHYQPL